MIYAYNQSKKRVEATETGQRAVCPCCDSEVISACGNFVVNHWKHKRKSDCDSWYQPMSEWHYNWQQQFPKEWREKVMFDKVTGEKHVADIRRPDGKVIEIQHSPIKVEEIESREAFYGDMIWVLDGRKLLSANVHYVKPIKTVTFYDLYEIHIDPIYFSVLKSNAVLNYIKEVTKKYGYYILMHNRVKSKFLKESDIKFNEHDGIVCFKLVVASHKEQDHSHLFKAVKAPSKYKLIDSYRNEQTSEGYYSYSSYQKRQFVKYIEKSVFIDNLENYPNHLWWLQREQLISKSAFINKFITNIKPKK